MAIKGIRDFVPAESQTFDIGTTVSKSIFTSPLGARTGVYQVVLAAGDRAVLQGRVDPTLPYIDILTVEDTSGIYEVILAPEMRVVVTNTSGELNAAAITG